MSSDLARLDRLIAELEAIRSSAYWLEQEHAAAVELGGESARNLVHYLALRRRDLRHLQDDLAALGLSSLGRAESHVLGTIDAVLGTLYRLAGRERGGSGEGPQAVSFAGGRRRLVARTDALFGHPSAVSGESGKVRIMVTMPPLAAASYELVRDLVASGMDCMRVNCAHDTPEAWIAMVRHLDEARRATGRACTLLMDLAGPKLRTGALEPGLRVVSWEPKRDPLGNVIGAASIWLTPLGKQEVSPPGTAAILPVDSAILAEIEPGDRLEFRDARGRKRDIRIRRRAGESLLGESDQITYLGAECPITVQPAKDSDPKSRRIPGEFLPAGIEARRQAISLRAGDTLRLTKDPAPGHPVDRDVEGRLVEEPFIPCTLPEVFRCVRPGDRILFDDGKITGVVLSASGDELRVRITHPDTEEKKLAEDKGINLPDSDIDLPALTSKDLLDLDFVVEHADMVGLSFVNRSRDVEDLQREIARRTNRSLGIVLKVETQRAFRELPRLLFTALRTPRVGVMIARGDLAVECGFQRLAEVQEEILWLCEAAHIPVIWATQVLERLSKKGMPSRAEISDAALGERAECVMLNKGPHVVDAVRVLRDIIGRMEGHMDKKTPMLRPLRVSELAELPSSSRRDEPGRPEAGAAALSG